MFYAHQLGDVVNMIDDMADIGGLCFSHEAANTGNADDAAGSWQLP